MIKEQSWLNFVFLLVLKQFLILDWCSDAFVPSVFMKETLFFLVFLNIKSAWFEIKWLEHLTVILSTLLIQSFIEEAFNQWIILIFCNYTQYLLFWCYYEDQCSKWILFLNSVPVDLMIFIGLRSDFPPPNRFKRFLFHVEDLHKFCMEQSLEKWKIDWLVI